MFSTVINNEAIQRLQTWSPGLSVPGVIYGNPTVSTNTPVPNLYPMPSIIHDPVSSTVPTHVENAGPLTQFLVSNGVGTDRTLFISMASEAYIEPMINFKVGLEKFNLGENLFVLCLDTPCLEAAKQHRILAYDGYLMNEMEAQGDWHHPIARVKVCSSQSIIWY